MPRRNAPRSIQAEDTLAERIAFEREGRDWSYERLADAMTEAGCPIRGSAIYKIEKGEPRRRITVDELLALASVFEVEDVEDLLTPVELLRKERAQELMQQVDGNVERVLHARDLMLEAATELFRLEHEDPDLYEYVEHRMGVNEKAESGGGDDATRLHTATRELFAAIGEAAREEATQTTEQEDGS